MCTLSKGERFKDARTVYNQHGSQSMDEVYKATGVSASMIKDLEDDEKSRSVGYEKVAILAKHYGVSSDFLLGLTDIPSKNYDVRRLAEMTGLTQDAIVAILRAKCSIESIQLIPLSYLLSNGFLGLVGLLSNFNRMEADIIKLENNASEYKNIHAKDDRMRWSKERIRLNDDIDVAKFKADNAFRKLMDEYFYRVKDPNTPEHKRIQEMLNHGHD